jgi:hypothetical protein
MFVYSDSVFEPAFSEPGLVSAKKNIKTEVEIEFFRPFPSLDQMALPFIVSSTVGGG